MIGDRISRVTAGEILEPARYTLLHRNGERLPVSSRAQVFTYGEQAGMLAVFQDQRKQDETDQQVREYQDRLRVMTSQIALAEEKERRRIAGGLHDHTVQSLGLLKIRLGQLESSQNGSPDSTRQFTEMRTLLDEIIRETRSLMFELSSPILYELGFAPAIKGKSTPARPEKC